VGGKANVLIFSGPLSKYKGIPADTVASAMINAVQKPYKGVDIVEIWTYLNGQRINFETDVKKPDTIQWQRYVAAGRFIIVLYRFLSSQDKSIEYDEDRPDMVDSFRILHLMITGNIYQSEYQIQHAFNPVTKKYDFSAELRYVNPILNLGDVVIANMKTGFTGDNTNPFSSPDELALALKYSGINNAVMANLNTAYLDKKGMTRTRKRLRYLISALRGHS